jgi:O-antigen/teichoic acid export membrane protein
MPGLIRQFLPASNFARHVATVAGATAFSQAVGLAALPVLTRLYAPGEYGAAAVYGGIVGLIVVIAALRYEYSIPLPRTDRGAFHAAIVAFIVLGGAALATALASPLLAFWWGGKIGLSRPVFAVLLVIGVLTASAYQITNYWAVRKSKFGAIARTRIQQGLAGPASQLVLGLAGFGALGLIVGQILGQCAGLGRLALGMIADNRRPARTIRPRGLAWAARRYRRFPIYDSWAGLLNVAGAQAPVLLFAALFTPTLAGYYALAVRILSAPLTLVGNAVSQVLMPRFIEANRHGEAGRLILKLFRVLAWLSFFPFTVAALISGRIIPLALGAQWAPAADVIAWTALWTACQFVTSPLSVAMAGAEAQKLHTGIQFILFALRIGGILAGAALRSPEFAVMGFTAASIAGYAVYLLAIGAVSGIRPSQFGLALCGPLALSAACALAVYAAGSSNVAAGSVLLVAGAMWGWQLLRIRLAVS